MATPDQEALWVLRAQCSDQEALELLLRHVQPALRRHLHRLVGSSDADDVLQEVLVQIYRKLSLLQDPRRFRAWAFRIASRAGFRHVRKRQRRTEQLEAGVVLTHVPAAKPPDDAQLEELLTTNQLSPAASAVLNLHFQEEMSLAEIAAVLELPLGTVKSRLAYGLARLRQRLAKPEEK